jgi:integrase
MSLNLYRRHRRDCTAGHAEESRSGELDERRKGWQRCSCPIFASGTLSKQFKRQTTGQWEWPSAKVITAQWETAERWDGKLLPPLPPVVNSVNREGQTISGATVAFLAELLETAAPATHKKYRLFLNQFNAFSVDRGYVVLNQWEPVDVRQFRSTWKVSPPTAVRRMAMLKPFFDYCMSNKWVSANPARAVKNPKGRVMSDRSNEQKLPFSDEEVKRMYAGCERYGRSYRHKWNGDDLADFISLSIYTGLRISDVATFHSDRLQEDGEIPIRTTKAGTHVCTWVPQWLQDRIRARAKQHGPLIFGVHTTKSLDVITDLWRRKLNILWKNCGPWKDNPTPHRFRHTFARILLQRPGITVRDVAELLGNTEEMVRKRYSAWVPERQERLTKALKAAFEDKPTPKIIAIR